MKKSLKRLKTEKFLSRADVLLCLEDIVLHLCFSRINPICQHIDKYEAGGVRNSLTVFVDTLVDKVQESVKLAQKAKTLEEFEKALFAYIIFCERVWEETYKNHDFLVREDVEWMSDEFKQELPFIFEKFFVKQRGKPGRRRKNIYVEQEHD